MVQTLFGTIENKAEARERAQKMAELYDALREAPEALDCRRVQIGDLTYFIERSNACKLDLNDHDGLHRLIGDPEELITARDCAFMRRHKRWWRKTPKGYLGYSAAIYCATLHPKEIKYLEDQRIWIQDEIDSIETNVPIIREQVKALKAVAPLPEDIAKRHGLTVDGDPLKPIEEKAKC
jgi:hypothetical protein